MRRYKTWQLLVILLLAIVVPVVSIVASNAASQDVGPTCKGGHTRKDFFKSIRMLPPASILEVVGNRLNYAITDEGIELGSLDLEPSWSLVPKDFKATCVGILYCEKHLVILRIDQLPERECKTTKF